MRPDDLVRVRHMLDAAQEAREFARGRQRSDLDEDRQLVLATVKSIEIVGEAAARVSDETQAAHPAIPWAAAVGMRNRLVHAYFDIDHDRVWDTIADDLPPLIAQLSALVDAAK